MISMCKLKAMCQLNQNSALSSSCRANANWKGWYGTASQQDVVEEYESVLSRQVENLIG